MPSHPLVVDDDLLHCFLDSQEELPCEGQEIVCGGKSHTVQHFDYLAAEGERGETFGEDKGQEWLPAGWAEPAPRWTETVEEVTGEEVGVGNECCLGAGDVVAEHAAVAAASPKILCLCLY